MLVSVIIPAYNEESVIAKTLTEVLAIEGISELIVVDDGSSDNTSAIVESFQKVRLIRHPYNIGNGAAIKSGIRAATGDYILMMDAEGQHPPAEIPNLLQYLGQYDMVVGARSSVSEAATHRSFANKIFNTYASYVVGYPVLDLTSGFRLIRRKLAQSFVYLLPNGYSYPTTLTIALFRSGFSVKYQSFVSPARKTGKSGIKPLRDGFRFLLTVTRLAIFFVPLKIFLPISLFCFIPGAVYTLSLLAFQGHFSGFGGLLTTLGLLIFLLGLIAEQISLLSFMNSTSVDNRNQ
jgi:glycosyltransferase involved in cell wall biosynthesis